MRIKTEKIGLLTSDENKISSSSGIGSIDAVSTTSIGVRPVLNLKAGVTGIASDPYRID